MLKIRQVLQTACTGAIAGVMPSLSIAWSARVDLCSAKGQQGGRHGVVRGAVPHSSAACTAGGTPGKRNRFREALLWNDPPEYFDGRFVAFTADVPADLLKAAVPPDDDSVKWTKEEAAPQFALIHHQYRQACGAACCMPAFLTLKL